MAKKKNKKKSKRPLPKKKKPATKVKKVVRKTAAKKKKPAAKRKSTPKYVEPMMESPEIITEVVMTTEEIVVEPERPQVDEMAVPTETSEEDDRHSGNW